MDNDNANIPNTSAEEVTTAPAAAEPVADEQVVAEETPAPSADAVAM